MCALSIRFICVFFPFVFSNSNLIVFPQVNRLLNNVTATHCRKISGSEELGGISLPCTYDRCVKTQVAYSTPKRRMSEDNSVSVAAQKRENGLFMRSGSSTRMIGRQPDFKEMTDALKDTYLGIDCRAIIAKKDNDWICVLAKIRLTRQGKSDVVAVHNGKVRSLGPANNEKVRVVMEYCELSELDRILSQIGKKEITIDGVKSQLQFTNNGISSDKASEDEGYVNSFQREGFPHLILGNAMDRMPSQLLNVLGITKKDMGMKFEDLASFLDIEKIGSTYNVVMVFPLYLKSLDIAEIERKNIIAKFLVHKAIAGALSATIKRVRGTTTDVRQKYPLSDKVAKNIEDMIEVVLPMPVTSVEPKDYLNFEIEHPVFDVVSANTIHAEELREILLLDDRLLSAFRAFEGANHFPADLFSGDEKYHVAATSWLFSLMGFNIIPIGLVNRSYENLVGPQGKRYSADLVGFHEKFLYHPLIIDCTTGVPDAQKLDHIRNTAAQVHGIISQDVIPVIVSTQDCSVVKSEATARSILLLDKDIVQTCASHVLSGNRHAALSTILAIYAASGGSP